MAYDNTGLFLITAAGGNNAQTWRYEGTDTPGAVAAAGFLSDAYDMGMRVGDIVEVIEFTSSAKTAVTSFSRMYASAVVDGTGATLQNSTIVTGTASSGAVTASGLVGQITTESLTTAAAAEYTLTITNAQVADDDLVFASVDANGSAGTPGIGGCTAAAGSVVITITNLHASAAFDGALKVNFMVIKA